MSYRYCAVLHCKNTSIKTPDKLFIHVPIKARKTWLNLANQPNQYTAQTAVYFCEDHFDLPRDMVNYMEYKLMGSVKRIQMSEECVPTKFECQKDRRKGPSLSAAVKRQKVLSKVCESILDESKIKEELEVETVLEEEGTVEKISSEELLTAVPNTVHFSKVPPELHADPFSDGLEPPLEFILENSNGDSSSTSVSLLYKLKHGLQGIFLSRLTLPQISTVRIESSDQSRFDKQSLKPASIPEVSIKLEPLDIDEEVDCLFSPCSKNYQDSPIMPANIKTESDSLSEDTCARLNQAKDNSDNCIFPLVFTFTGLTCSQYDLDSPLLYSLKHGPCEMPVTSLTQPKVISIQIHSLTQAILNLKKDNSTSLLTVNTLTQFQYKSQAGVEGFPPTSSLTSTHSSNMPVILNVSSCKKRKTNDSSDTYTSNGTISSIAHSTNKEETLPTNEPELKNDEDYQFLMSLLPELKQIPANQKQQVKKKIQEFVTTSRMCANKFKFENMRSNIYRDCRVLPALRDWKF